MFPVIQGSVVKQGGEQAGTQYQACDHKEEQGIGVVVGTVDQPLVPLPDEQDIGDAKSDQVHHAVPADWKPRDY